jgi:hypothetical protein
MRRLHVPRLDRGQQLLTLDIVKFVMMTILLVGFINFNVKLSKTVQGETGLLAKANNLATQNKDLSEQIKQGNTGIHSQINCVLEFFSQAPIQRTNSSISDPKQCIIASSPESATGATKSGPVDVSPPLQSVSAPLNDTGTQARSSPLTSPSSRPTTAQKPSQPPTSNSPTQKIVKFIKGLL